MSPTRNLSEFYTRPDWVRRINLMGASVGGAANLVPLDADELVRRAVESTAAATTSVISMETGARASTRCSASSKQPASSIRWAA